MLLFKPLKNLVFPKAFLILEVVVYTLHAEKYSF